MMSFAGNSKVKPGMQGPRAHDRWRVELEEESRKNEEQQRREQEFSDLKSYKKRESARYERQQSDQKVKENGIWRKH